MGKKNRKSRAAQFADSGVSRTEKRESLELINQILAKCCQPVPSGTNEYQDYMLIHSMVQELRKKQSKHLKPNADRLQQVTKFKEWLDTNKVTHDAVEITMFENEGLGLKAKRLIGEKELFLEIPRNVMMTTESAAESEFLGPLIQDDQMLSAMPNVCLALHILTEKKKGDSFWKPYIDILPHDYNTPLYFNGEDIQYLKGSPIQRDIINQNRNIARQYCYFYKKLQDITDPKYSYMKDFLYDEYRWAVSSIMTRQNQIPSKAGTQGVMALIPLWDMCNHRNGQITTDFDEKSDCGQCFCLKEYQTGDQIFIFYGPRSNAEFLLHSGFVYPDNDYNRVAVKLGISKNDHLFSMKAEALARLSMLSSRSFYLHKGDSPVDSDLLAFLRVFSMDLEELKARITGENSTQVLSGVRAFDTPVSEANETKCWQYLSTRMALLVKSYPTTIQEDNALLKKVDISEHRKLVIQLRKGEKEILQNTEAFAERQLQMMKERKCEDVTNLEDDLDKIVVADDEE